MEANVRYTGRTLARLEPTSIDEICKIIIQAPSKSYNVDLLLTWLRREILDFLLPIMKIIIMQSINQYIIPV